MPISSGIARFLLSVGTTLQINTITDGEFLKRSGNTIVSQSIGSLGGGDFSGAAASTDSELIVFSGTSGKVGKRTNTLSGIVKLTSGVVSVVTAPAGTIVGTTDSQTLTNKILTSPAFTNPTSSSMTLDTGSTLTFTGSTSGTPILKSAPIGGSGTFQLPNTIGGTHTLADLDSVQTLTNKTLSGTVNTISNIDETMLVTSDITTLNVSISKHGFAPKLPNDATKYLDGTGAYTVPAGGGGGSIGGSTGSTDNAVIRANGTGGATIQSSGVTIDDSNNVSTTGTLTVGSGGGTTSDIAMSGATSGTVHLKVADVAGTHTIKLPTADGTSNQVLKTDGSGQWGWTSVGSGTVTATGGSLTANAVVLGAGTTDTKVVAGITSDGANKIVLGVAGTSVGGVDFKNATSGTITLAPPAGALGTVTATLPLGGTLATTGGTETFTNKTLTAPKFADLGFIADANGNELIILDTVASAVNEVTFANAATGSAPTFTATGGDTDVSINFVPKGAGTLQYGGTEVGFRIIPQNSKSAAYTTVAADSGKHILHPTADNNARTFTIDSNANVPYPIGTAITFVNQINTVTISITSDTLTLFPGGSTGSRTLAAGNMATALKVSTTGWIITGTSGLT